MPLKRRRESLEIRVTRLLGKWVDKLRSDFDATGGATLSVPEAAAANVLIQTLKCVRSATPKRRPVVSQSMKEELEKLSPERLQEIILSPGPGRPKKETDDATV